jgi:hypothetical protein
VAIAATSLALPSARGIATHAISAQARMAVAGGHAGPAKVFLEGRGQDVIGSDAGNRDRVVGGIGYRVRVDIGDDVHGGSRAGLVGERF